MGRSIKKYVGKNGLIKLAEDPETDIVVMSIVGTAGLEATIAAIKKGKTIALASKEILVAAGNIIMRLAKKYGASILPLDSEHSAVFQCLEGRIQNQKSPFIPQVNKFVKRIILTASGGPFRKYLLKELKKVTVKEALAHPTWDMGPKITIDSASLMNKGLEVIEAHYLFGVPYEKIDVVVHPQSIIHSMVEFMDGSILAQMGLPDMRTPIQYALFYPERSLKPFGIIDFAEISSLTFEKPNYKKFPCLKLAFFAGKAGGTMPAVLTSANDAAVELFLNSKIKFADIPRVISRVMRAHKLIKNPSIDQILEVENWAREEALK